jgi:hypothetical protein
MNKYIISPYSYVFIVIPLYSYLFLILWIIRNISLRAHLYRRRRWGLPSPRYLLQHKLFGSSLSSPNISGIEFSRQYQPRVVPCLMKLSVVRKRIPVPGRPTSLVHWVRQWPIDVNVDTQSSVALGTTIQAACLSSYVLAENWWTFRIHPHLQVRPRHSLTALMRSYGVTSRRSLSSSCAADPDGSGRSLRCTAAINMKHARVSKRGRRIPVGREVAEPYS